MEACEKALEFCPMLGYTDGSPTQLVIRAQEDGFRSGWRAALERALKAGQDAGLENFIPVSWVNKELEEKNEPQTVEQNPQCYEQGTEG